MFLLEKKEKRELKNKVLPNVKNFTMNCITFTKKNTTKR